jgi:hypothetical protein
MKMDILAGTLLDAAMVGVGPDHAVSAYVWAIGRQRLGPANK